MKALQLTAKNAAGDKSFNVNISAFVNKNGKLDISEKIEIGGVEYPCTLTDGKKGNIYVEVAKITDRNALNALAAPVTMESACLKVNHSKAVETFIKANFIKTYKSSEQMEDEDMFKRKGETFFTEKN